MGEPVLSSMENLHFGLLDDGRLLNIKGFDGMRFQRKELRMKDLYRHLCKGLQKQEFCCSVVTADSVLCDRSPRSERTWRFQHSTCANTEEILPMVMVGKTRSKTCASKSKETILGREPHSKFIPRKDLKKLDSKFKQSNYNSSDPGNKIQSVCTLDLEKNFKKMTGRRIQSKLIRQKGKAIDSKLKRSNNIIFSHQAMKPVPTVDKKPLKEKMGSTGQLVENKSKTLDRELKASNSSELEPRKGVSVHTLENRTPIKKLERVQHTSQDTSGSNANLKLDADNNVRIHFPTFPVEMKRSNVIAGFWLIIPAEFSCEHMPRKDETIILQDAQGLKWETKYLARKNSLSAGWKRFAMDHRLELGEMLVFELVRPLEFRVHIIGVSNVRRAAAVTASHHTASIPNHMHDSSPRKRMKI
ncbi:unnamed protein product [Calypogeia fissa]